MQPLFTIHAGEYLVGSYIEQNLRCPNGEKLNVWVPSKDTGVDLLVTDKANKQTTSLQVKFSKDFLATDRNKRDYKAQLKACGWWKLNPKKIADSPAEFWVFVLPAFESQEVQYMIISRDELYRRLSAIHSVDKPLHLFFWVGKEGDKRWEVRDLGKGPGKTRDKGPERELVKTQGEGFELDPNRDFSEFLNDWQAVFRHWS